MRRLVAIVLLTVGACVVPAFVGHYTRSAVGFVGTLKSTVDDGRIGFYRQQMGGEAVPGADAGGGGTGTGEAPGPGVRVPVRLQGSVPLASLVLRRPAVAGAGHLGTLAVAIWVVFGGLVLLALAALALERYGLARACGQASLRIATIEMTVFSAAAILLHLAGIQFLSATPLVLWLSPPVFVLTSAGLLRVVDLNYPVWNETVGALAAPFVASLVILGWDRVVPLLAARGSGRVA